MSTINEVAAKANVSIKTVSRVINDEPGVADATRRRVKQAINELNYVPNVSAQRLKRGRSELLALVLPRVESPYAIKLFANVLAETRKHDYSLLVFESDPSEARGLRLIERAVKNHRVDGVIVAPPGGDSPNLIDFLQQNQMPYLVIGPNRVSPEQMSVEPTDRIGGFEATQYLTSLGHERIAHITGMRSERFSQERLEGYRQALEQAGLPVRPQLIAEGDNSMNSGHDAAMKLLTAPEPPTAIFASNDEMAVGVIIAALHLKIPIPEELSIIGFDDAPISQSIHPRLTTIAQPIDQIARVSVELLVQWIEGKQDHMVQMMIPTRLVPRNSCAIARVRHADR